MARPKLGDSESLRLQMVITADEVAAIDNWQHKNHVASRSEAIRRLAQIALAFDAKADQIEERAKELSKLVTSTGEELAVLIPFLGLKENDLPAEELDDIFTDLLMLTQKQLDLALLIGSVTEPSRVFRGQEKMSELVERAAAVKAQMDKVIANSTLPKPKRKK